MFFALEEPPAFRTHLMGSHVYAARARGEELVGMICLETVGFCGDRPGDQAFPLSLLGLLYPTTPNFVAVVGDRSSRHQVRSVAEVLRGASDLPVETLSAPRFLPGVDL